MTADPPIRLQWDPTACDGVGVCAHVAGAIIAADTWGYPIIDSRPLTSRGERRAARAAVRACPHRALTIQDV